jgi:hypothetical protein
MHIMGQNLMPPFQHLILKVNVGLKGIHFQYFQGFQHIKTLITYLQDPTIINIEAMKELELIGLKVRMQTLQD